MPEMTENGTGELDGGKRSAWMAHVKKTMRSHKGLKLKQVLKMASKTFKKSRRGGGLSPLPLGGDAGGAPAGAATVGGRRRGSRKSRKSRSRKH